MDLPFSTKAALLELLYKEPAYGRELMERISKLSDGKWVPAAGSVYPAIAGLEKDGFIKMRREITVARTKAFIYEITVKGKKLVEDHRTVFQRIFFSDVAFPTAMPQSPCLI